MKATHFRDERFHILSAFAEYHGLARGDPYKGRHLLPIPERFSGNCYKGIGWKFAIKKGRHQQIAPF
jgi:hypothetical protein